MQRRPYREARPRPWPRITPGTPGNPRTPSGCPILAQLITDARLARHMYQHELATALGVDRHRISAWEVVRRPVAWDVIEALASLLDPGNLWHLEPFRVRSQPGLFARVVSTEARPRAPADAARA